MRPMPCLFVAGLIAALVPSSSRADEAGEPRSAAPAAQPAPAQAAPSPPPVYYICHDGQPCYPASAPPPAPRAEDMPPPGDGLEPLFNLKDVHSQIAVHGSSTNQGYMAGAFLAVESKLVGLDASIDALAEEQVTGPVNGHDHNDPAALGSAHVTWTVLSESWITVHALTGGSMLALPKTDFTRAQPWAGKTIYGADLGISGSIRLAGPVRAEGHARVTPYPTRIADTYAGIALLNGPIGLVAGWRWVEVHGDGIDAPRMSYSGPQAGLTFRF